MLNRIFCKNICAFQSALGASRNVQTWRRLSQMNASSPPRKEETQQVCPSTLSSVHGINPRSVQQPEQSSPQILGRLLSRLSLSPEEAAATVQYNLPSRSPVTRVAILDPAASVAIPWDCPTASTENCIDMPSHREVDVFIEDPSSDRTVTKKASNILQKRHRKMKRHQYKKWRKRNRFKLRMQKQRRRKKRKERWERHLNRFRFANLKASEGEQYLEKKREKLHLYLRYLGVDFEDGTEQKEMDDQQGKKKKKRGQSCVMSPEGTGSIIPKPIVPEGARML